MSLKPNRKQTTHAKAWGDGFRAGMEYALKLAWAAVRREREAGEAWFRAQLAEEAREGGAMSRKPPATPRGRQT